MSLKIMVVDDEWEVLNLIKTMVEPLGYEILALGDSREAAKRLEGERFDGLFVDARMPHVDGFELSKRARASSLNRGLPIVMLTGFDDVETMRKGFKAGVTFFLGKPFTREKLISLCRAARGTMLREKRRHLRLLCRTVVNCTVDEKPFKSGSLNIGEGGMLLESSGGAAVGQIVELEFQLPTASRPIAVRAKAVRKEPPDRIVVEFLNLEQDGREAIQRYIASGSRE